MDYGFSKTFIAYIRGLPDLTGRFQTIGQFLPEGMKCPALTVFTDKVEAVNTSIPGQEQVKIYFVLKAFSSYNGLQELYELTDLLERNFNGLSLESEDEYKFYIRLSPPSFEGIQKTKTCDYRSVTIKGIGYAVNL